MRLWLQITCGRGPVECAWAVPRLLQEIASDAIRQGVVAEVLETISGRYPDTLCSALLAIEGEAAEVFCRSWVGSICWSARSPFRANCRRKNWFVGVEVLAPPARVSWSDSELRFETMRASGPGGQHVNKTESAVRVIHVPSGMSATAREERSQWANRKLAVARLAEQFVRREKENQRAAQQRRWMQHNCVERGRPLRTFVGMEFREQKA